MNNFAPIPMGDLPVRRACGGAPHATKDPHQASARARSQDSPCATLNEPALLSGVSQRPARFWIPDSADTKRHACGAHRWHAHKGLQCARGTRHWHVAIPGPLRAQTGRRLARTEFLPPARSLVQLRAEGALSADMAPTSTRNGPAGKQTKGRPHLRVQTRPARAVPFPRAGSPGN